MNIYTTSSFWESAINASTGSVDPAVVSLETSFKDQAASKVAQELGIDANAFFPPGERDGIELHDYPTKKIGGHIEIQNTTYATAQWYFGTNTKFEQHFSTLFNNELSLLNNTIRVDAIDSPFNPNASSGAEEGDQQPPSSGLDLRVGSFLLLLQIVGGHITNEKTTNMYYYMTRIGMLPTAFWLFQYLYYLVLSLIMIGITTLVGLIVGKDVDFVAYLIGSWFNIAFAALLGSIFKNKKVINLGSFFLLIIALVVPAVFASIEKSESNIRTYENILCIPVFFALDNITTYQKNVGSIISAICTVLAAYLVPLLTVSEGMYAGSKVNYFYFLSPKFWKEGIVALPSYDEQSQSRASFNDSGGFDDHMNGSQRLIFENCVKIFAGKDTTVTIGPMNLKLESGNITTLLGPNGVGKSTLMRVAAGYYIPSAGEMVLEGHNTFRERPWSCLQSISFCPQENYIYDYLTVEEHMYLVSSFRDMSSIDGGDVVSHINWILTTIDMAHKTSTLAKNLSGGMKRRLCLAMSVVGFPKVILCDEPSSGVDTISQRGIWKLLETIKKKSAILLTSHSALEAVILSDSVVMMKTSEDITQTAGTQGMAFSLKDVDENKTTEYEVNMGNVREVAGIVESLPNDGSEWKVASKRLTDSVLPPLQDVLKKDHSSADNEGDEVQMTDTLPETHSTGTPGLWRQILVLMSMMFLHIDRIFFLVVFGLPIIGGQLWVGIKYSSFGFIAKFVITSLAPMIAIIGSSIILVQMTEIFATERTLGITKLLFSSGVSQFAYLASYIILYWFLSFPFSCASLILIGSEYGTVEGMVAIFFLFGSIHFLILGICIALGAVLDARTAFICTLILPSVFSIFAYGPVSQSFYNAWPGSTGQIIAGLLIDDVDTTEWILYAVSFIVNIIIGLVSFYIFMVRMANYNPIAKLCGKKTEPEVQSVENRVETADIENYGTNEDDIFLKGQSIVKLYGVGEKDSLSFRALDDVTFSVPNGSLLGLVGKSGAGKSTLMDILAGQLSVTSGAVYVEGRRVHTANISKVVSMCGQLDTMWPDMKVINAIKIFMRCRGYRVNSCGLTISDPYVQYIIGELQMEEFLNKKVKTLSGGQKRRLAFLVSLLGNTKVVLVDEAMTGVDIETRKIMWKILQDEVRLRDRSVVVTSHEISEIEQYCNSVGILHDGKLVEMGPLNDIKKKWSDSIKLICLFSSLASISMVENVIVQNHEEIMVEAPHVDVLDELEQTRIVATYQINLVNIENIAGLINTVHGLQDSSLLYWSVEPQSLDDFVRSKSEAVLGNVKL